MRASAIFLVAVVIVLASMALATQDLRVAWSEVHIVSEGMEDTGRISLAAKLDKQGKWLAFEAEAFGRKIQLDEKQLAGFAGFPLSGIEIGYEGEPQKIKDHEVSFRIVRPISDDGAKVVTSVIFVSVTKSGQLQILGPSEEQLIRLRP